MIRNSSPLDWPLGWKRTQRPRISKFGSYTIDQAASFVRDEIRRLTGSSSFIISTNLRYRIDGMPYSGQRQPDDKGVAVYFMMPDTNRHNQEKVIACDAFTRIECNLYAIAKTIEAMRGINRWGSSELITRAFTGFKALAEHASQPSWQSVLELPINATEDQVREQYRALSKKYHPDMPTGNAEKFVIIKHAYEDAMQQLGG